MHRRIYRVVSEFVESLEPRRLLTTYYLDASAGNNANAGTSPAAAWQTVGQVALRKFKAGDSILLKGGQIFYGKLYLDSSDKGTSAAPINIGTFGSGRAEIQSGNDAGIFLLNTAGVKITNLTITGSGSSTNKSAGIYCYTDVAGGVKWATIHINTVDVKGYKNGIAIGGGNGTSGFSDVQITSSTVHDNAHAGIFTFGAAMYAHKGVYIGKCYTWNNVGIAADPGVSGHGIVLGSVEGGTIERCVSYSNGSVGNGGAGVWTYDSTKILIQFSESFDNRTGGPHDGDGFDLDQNVSNSVMQYNYSHGNDGAGFLMSTKYNNALHKNNYVRYNISQNDCRKLDYGALHIWGRVGYSEWHNNTVYLTRGAATENYGIKIVNTSITNQCVSSVHFRNNIIVTTGSMPLINVSGTQLNGATDLQFQGNAYYSSGATFKIKWGSTTYNTLSSWRSARNQEKINGAAVGFSGDPQLVAPGGGQTIGNADKLTKLTAYQLLSTSPLINAGINLFSTFGLGDGGKDFWGSPTPAGGKHDIGADEY